MALIGCTFSGVNLVHDDRVEILSPAPQEEVPVGPVTIEWSAEDVEGLKFAVFVDHRVVRPNHELEDLVPDDDFACLNRPECPDDTWLSGRGVYITDDTRITLDSLRDNRSEATERDKHTVAIVLLDGQRRDGDSAWYREFYVDRGDL